MSGISLTASMRSNLLSLQTISGQVSSTQNKLSTGNKVNSAIDNPSSYYTALSLNNRADDLNALLDSMGQAVSTIKAATTALESATDFLEQASAVATQALETAKVPDKSFFEEKVGENGAVVTTAQELRDAINSGKETICVYGAIDLGDISQTGGLTLQENQKLVGVGYFGNYDTDTDKFSSISATANTANRAVLRVTQDGNVLSDLSINYNNTVESGAAYAVFVDGGGDGKSYQATLSNLDIQLETSSSQNNGVIRIGIFSYNKSTTNIEGKINIQTLGRLNYGVYINNSEVNINDTSKVYVKTVGESANGISAYTQGVININSGSKVDVEIQGTGGAGIWIYNQARCTIDPFSYINVKTFGDNGYGIYGDNKATININSGANININTSGQESYGIICRMNSINNIQHNSQINIFTTGLNGHGICSCIGSLINIEGNINIDVKTGQGIINALNGSSINIASLAQVYFNVGLSALYNGYNDGTGPNILDIAAGAKLAFEKDGKTDWYEVKEDWQDKNTSTTTNNAITADNVKDKLNVEETTAWELPEKIEKYSKEEAAQDLSGDSKQYQEILNQYDALIKDANYKGINLLQPEKLTVKFNEDNTAALEVIGKDMSSKALGFTIFEWQTQGDINKSIEELTSAINSIRNYSSELGNNYNIITTRQDFTDNLINILTEGADKLTLADMNEESANMLALQTRQQLAINSLSLASQASQSILKLF